jgi:hypothetical protein
MEYASPRFFIPQKATFVKWVKSHTNIIDITKQVYNQKLLEIFMGVEAYAKKYYLQ